MATVREIAGYLEERVPSSLKLDFDNVGLLCGFPEREVSRVLVVLDITQQAIEEALSLHAELIVSIIRSSLHRCAASARTHRTQSASLLFCKGISLPSVCTRISTRLRAA